MWLAFLRAERSHQGIFPLPYDALATPYLRAIVGTLREYQPDGVVYGLFPEVAVACAISGRRHVSFSPLELSSFRDWMHRYEHGLLQEKLGLVKYDGPNMRKNPWEVIQNAAVQCGLELSTSSSVQSDPSTATAQFMEAIHPNHTILCDFECLHQNDDYLPPNDVTIVGPLISSDDSNLCTSCESKDLEEIESFLSQATTTPSKNSLEPPIKALMTMGSTGELMSFLEGLKALCNAELGTFRSVVMIPANILNQSNAGNALLESAEYRHDICTVKKYVPARPVMKSMDVILCHGGQLTIQCAMAAGVPIVGTPTQLEQLYNLERIEKKCKAGVCMPAGDWNEDNICNALVKVGRRDSSYKEAASRMQLEFLANGRYVAKRVVSIVWEVITKNHPNTRSGCNV